jgi:hypothetical protein
VSRSAVQHERAVLVLAIAILPWVALSRIGEWRSTSTPSFPKASVAIDSLSSRVAVASDRTSFTFQARRADRTRHVSTTPPGWIGISTALVLGSAVSPSSSIGRTELIAFHLACRGPPSLAVI